MREKAVPSAGQFRPRAGELNAMDLACRRVELPGARDQMIADFDEPPRLVVQFLGRFMGRVTSKLGQPRVFEIQPRPRLVLRPTRRWMAKMHEQTNTTLRQTGRLTVNV